ncbi:MAG: class I SAM-dependent methyltransferase [Chitinispirillaceae bacterium]
MNLSFDPQKFTLCNKTSALSSLKLVRPRDPETVLDTISDEQYEKDKFLPYWAELWPSSEVLFEYLTKNPIRKGFRAIELGCGIGHISAFLVSRGVDTVATDISREACCYARYNTISNGGKGKCLCCDWRHSPFTPNRFDLVIASDVLYERRWIDPVLSFSEELVSQNGEVLVADPCRSHWSEFRRCAAQRGFEVRIVVDKLVNEGNTTVQIASMKKAGK